MTRELHQTTQDLIIDYYQKDRRVTVATLILATIGVTTVIVSAFWLYQSRQKLDNQQAQILQLQNTINDRTKDIQTQISCVGAYFTQTDRANLKIPSLTTCDIVRVK